MSHTLQMKVKKYLEYMFHDNQEQKRIMLFNSLSNKLKEEVQIDIYGKILRNNKFFKANFSDKFLQSLSLKFSEQTLAPEEIIYSVFSKEISILILIFREIRDRKMGCILSSKETWNILLRKKSEKVLQIYL